MGRRAPSRPWGFSVIVYVGLLLVSTIPTLRCEHASLATDNWTQRLLRRLSVGGWGGIAWGHRVMDSRGNDTPSKGGQGRSNHHDEHSTVAGGQPGVVSAAGDHVNAQRNRIKPSRDHHDPTARGVNKGPSADSKPPPEKLLPVKHARAHIETGHQSRDRSASPPPLPPPHDHNHASTDIDVRHHTSSADHHSYKEHADEHEHADTDDDGDHGQKKQRPSSRSKAPTSHSSEESESPSEGEGEGGEEGEGEEEERPHYRPPRPKTVTTTTTTTTTTSTSDDSEEEEDMQGASRGGDTSRYASGGNAHGNDNGYSSNGQWVMINGDEVWVEEGSSITTEGEYDIQRPRPSAQSAPYHPPPKRGYAETEQEQPEQEQDVDPGGLPYANPTQFGGGHGGAGSHIDPLQAYHDYKEVVRIALYFATQHQRAGGLGGFRPIFGYYNLTAGTPIDEVPKDAIEAESMSACDKSLGDDDNARDIFNTWDQSVSQGSRMGDMTTKFIKASVSGLAPDPSAALRMKARYALYDTWLKMGGMARWRGLRNGSKQGQRKPPPPSTETHSRHPQHRRHLHHNDHQQRQTRLLHPHRSHAPFHRRLENRVRGLQLGQNDVRDVYQTYQYLSSKITPPCKKCFGGWSRASTPGTDMSASEGNAGAHSTQAHANADDETCVTHADGSVVLYVCTSVRPNGPTMQLSGSVVNTGIEPVCGFTLDIPEFASSPSYYPTWLPVYEGTFQPGDVATFAVALPPPPSTSLSRSSSLPMASSPSSMAVMSENGDKGSEAAQDVDDEGDGDDDDDDGRVQEEEEGDEEGKKHHSNIKKRGKGPRRGRAAQEETDDNEDNDVDDDEDGDEDDEDDDDDDDDDDMEEGGDDGDKAMYGGTSAVQLGLGSEDHDGGDGGVSGGSGNKGGHASAVGDVVGAKDEDRGNDGGGSGGGSGGSKQVDPTRGGNTANATTVRLDDAIKGSKDARDRGHGGGAGGDDSGESVVSVLSKGSDTAERGGDVDVNVNAAEGTGEGFKSGGGDVSGAGHASSDAAATITTATPVLVVDGSVYACGGGTKGGPASSSATSGSGGNSRAKHPPPSSEDQGSATSPIDWISMGGTDTSCLASCTDTVKGMSVCDGYNVIGVSRCDTCDEVTFTTIQQMCTHTIGCEPSQCYAPPAAGAREKKSATSDASSWRRPTAWRGAAVAVMVGFTTACAAWQLL